MLTQANRVCTRTASCHGHESIHSRKIKTCWRDVLAYPHIQNVMNGKEGANERATERQVCSLPFSGPLAAAAWVISCALLKVLAAISTFSTCTLETDKRLKQLEVDLVRAHHGATRERLEEDPNGDPAIDVRAVIVLGLNPLLRLHDALAQQPLCSRELHAWRNALADPRDDLDLGKAL